MGISLVHCYYLLFQKFQQKPYRLCYQLESFIKVTLELGIAHTQLFFSYTYYISIYHDFCKAKLMALKISIFLELVFYLPETWFLSIKHITYWHHHQHKFFAFMRAYFIVNAYLAGKIKYLFCKKFQKYLNNNSPKTPLKSKAELGQVETSSQKFWVSKKLHDEKLTAVV